MALGPSSRTNQFRNPPPPGFVLDKPPFDPSKPYEVVEPRPNGFNPDEYVADERRAASRFLALVPPAFVLALGSALVWALRGSR